MSHFLAVTPFGPNQLALFGKMICLPAPWTCLFWKCGQRFLRADPFDILLLKLCLNQVYFVNWHCSIWLDCLKLGMLPAVTLGSSVGKAGNYSIIIFNFFLMQLYIALLFLYNIFPSIAPSVVAVVGSAELVH